MSSLATAQGVPSCLGSPTHLRKAPIGFVCQTDNGSLFERVDHPPFTEAWRDEDGHIWSETIGVSNPESLDQKSAEARCAQMGGVLPSISELVKADRHHFRYVLRGVSDQPSLHLWYWSSSADPFKTGELPGGNRISCSGGALLSGLFTYNVTADAVACDSPSHTYYVATCLAQ